MKYKIRHNKNWPARYIALSCQTASSIIICSCGSREKGKVNRSGRSMNIATYVPSQVGICDKKLPNLMQLVIERTKNWWPPQMFSRELRTSMKVIREDFLPRTIPDIIRYLLFRIYCYSYTAICVYLTTYWTMHVYMIIFISCSPTAFSIRCIAPTE